MSKFFANYKKWFFYGFLKKIVNLFTDFLQDTREKRTVNSFVTSFNHHYSVLYNRPVDKTLPALCDKYGSDKGSISNQGRLYNWQPHTYTDYYHDLFSHSRKNILKVFECGIGTDDINLRGNMGANASPGASLRVWRDYFPNASIVGADIDKNILFSEDRIKTFFVDQTKKQSIKNMWSNIGYSDFDLMVDDGLHTYEGGCCLFENSIEYLSNNGVYIIEDVKVLDLIKYKKYFECSTYKVEFVNLYRIDGRLLDNSLVVIRK